MKVSFGLKCSFCDCPGPANSDIGTHEIVWLCPNCNNPNQRTLDTDVTLGFQILMRSADEYRKEEFDLSIVLSAMALDAELSRLYVKWTRLDSAEAIDPDVIEEKMRRRFRRSRDKIDGIATILQQNGLDEFVQRSEFAETVRTAFPSLHIGSLSRDIERTVFWPRNAILHAGKTFVGNNEAARAYSIASLSLRILSAMNRKHAEEAVYPV